MKLRTRIIGISCITVLAASMICELFIWMYTGKNLKNEAILKGMQEYSILVRKIEQEIADNPGSNQDEISLNYLIKSLDDNYNICYLLNTATETDSEESIQREVSEVEEETEKQEVVEVYNNTVFTYEQLNGLQYQSDTSIVNIGNTRSNSTEELLFSSLNYEGRNYIVYNTMLLGNVCIYRVYDITYVQENLIELALVMAGITLIVMTIAIIVLLMILKKEFKPLQQLNDTAKSMAEGYYDNRIDIKKKDEIGQLAENFNKMAEAVELRTNSLEESEQRKTIFMGNLTHELKTPMTAISGYAQTLLSTKISEEDQGEALQYIYEECGRLERLSKKMMNLLELGQSEELKFCDTLVKTIFEAVEKSCKVILEEKQIALQCIEHGEHFNMESDLMTDVLINLVDNAVKASEPGSEIILRAQDNRIEVQDFGRGIPKEEQEKILEPFYMIDKSRSRKNGGAGLGLALIAVIVQKHNIKMSIESDVGKGSKFVLEF